jgi:hypothetical protein
VPTKEKKCDEQQIVGIAGNALLKLNVAKLVNSEILLGPLSCPEMIHFPLPAQVNTTGKDTTAAIAELKFQLMLYFEKIFVLGT